MLMVDWKSVLFQPICLLHGIPLTTLCSVGFEKPSAIQQRGIVPFCKGLDVIQQAQFMRALGDQLGVKVHACGRNICPRGPKEFLASCVLVVVGKPGRVFDMLRRVSLRPDNIKMFVL